MVLWQFKLLRDFKKSKCTFIATETNNQPVNDTIECDAEIKNITTFVICSSSFDIHLNDADLLMSFTMYILIINYNVRL